jgi:hypothetical protein
MSKVVDVSKPEKLTDFDLRYAYDRGMISEEVMFEHMSEAAKKVMAAEAFGGLPDEEDAPPAKATKASKAKAEDESDNPPG